MQLTPKETGLLKDLRDQEKLCVDKYTKHSQAACAGQLKQLFTQLAANEQKHYDSIVQLQSGTVPQVPQTAESPSPAFTPAYNAADCSCGCGKETDTYLCSDVLAAEKHVSHLYDTCVFEFSDADARNLLNHIQKEEQEHGKAIYDFMTVNGMYS